MKLNIAVFSVGILIGIVLYHYILIHKVIDNRANDLGIMSYSSTENKMIPNQELKWTLHYLKNGTMN